MKRRPNIRKSDDDAAQAAENEAPNVPFAANDEEPDDNSDLDESSDLDCFGLIGIDEKHWDVFIADEDDGELLPDYGDFWMPD